MGRPKGSARPGVKRNPLTKLELDTLQMLADGFKPKKLLRQGERPIQVWKRMDRTRLKLDAFTTAHMVAEGLRRGLIK